MGARSLRRDIGIVMLGVVIVLAIITLLQQPASPFSGLPAGVVRIPTSVMSTDPDLLCNLGAVVPPLSGVLRGDKADEAWPVWLTDAGGRDIYVRWPSGWSARFDPAVELLDERGRVAASAGMPIELTQVLASSAAGSRSDPYVASGSFLGRCYARL
jgi:hypothetical protein